MGFDPGSVTPASDPRIDLSREIQKQRDAIAAGTHVIVGHAFMAVETARQLSIHSDPTEEES